MIAHPHWSKDYPAAAHSCGLDKDLPTAVREVNTWITQIDFADTPEAHNYTDKPAISAIADR